MAMIHVNRGATSLGVFPEEQIREGIRAGRFLPSDLGWREGMASWQPLSEFTEFAADIAAARPPSGAPPPQTPTAPAIIAPTAGTTSAPRSGLPWDERHSKGLFSAFIETLQMVLSRPSDAFTAMRREGGLGEPLLYAMIGGSFRSEEHTSELQSQSNLVCRLLLEKKKNKHSVNTEAAIFHQSDIRRGPVVCSFV